MEINNIPLYGSILEESTSPIFENGKIISSGKKKKRLILEGWEEEKVSHIAIKIFSKPHFSMKNGMKKNFILLIHIVTHFFWSLFSQSRYILQKITVDNEEVCIYLNIQSLKTRLKKLGFNENKIQKCIKNGSPLSPLTNQKIKQKINNFISPSNILWKKKEVLEITLDYAKKLDISPLKALKVTKKLISFNLTISEIRDLIDIIHKHRKEWAKIDQTKKISPKQIKNLPRKLHIYPNDIIVIIFNKPHDPIIGSGTFMEARFSVDLLKGKKILHLKSKNDESFFIYINTFFALLNKIKHKNLLDLYVRKDEINNLYLLRKKNIYEFLVHYNGDILAKKIEKDNPYTMEQITLFTYQLLSAGIYLQEMNIIHRDIKPENVCIKKNQATLIDFGFALDLNDSNTVLAPYCCSPMFVPPEYAKARCYIESIEDEKAIQESITIKYDAWCLGITLLLLYQQKIKDWALTELPAESANNEEDCFNKIGYCPSDWLAKPEENSIEFCIWMLLRVDQKERWSIKQAFEFAGPLIEKDPLMRKVFEKEKVPFQFS